MPQILLAGLAATILAAASSGPRDGLYQLTITSEGVYYNMKGLSAAQTRLAAEFDLPKSTQTMSVCVRKGDDPVIALAAHLDAACKAPQRDDARGSMSGYVTCTPNLGNGPAYRMPFDAERKGDVLTVKAFDNFDSFGDVRANVATNRSVSGRRIGRCKTR